MITTETLNLTKSIIKNKIFLTKKTKQQVASNNTIKSSQKWVLFCNLFILFNRLKNTPVRKFQKVERADFYELFLHVTKRNTILQIINKEENINKRWSTKSLKKTEIRKNTYYNLEQIVKSLFQFIKGRRMRRVIITVKGTGIGRRFVRLQLKKRFRGFLTFFTIKADRKRVFNGCRTEKRKRK